MSDPVAALLNGAVDLHVHPAPSPMPRRIHAAEPRCSQRKLASVRW